jgi:hypothetical protein
MTGSWCHEGAVKIEDDSPNSICMHFIEAKIGEIAVYEIGWFEDCHAIQNSSSFTQVISYISSARLLSTWSSVYPSCKKCPSGRKEVPVLQLPEWPKQALLSWIGFKTGKR